MNWKNLVIVSLVALLTSCTSMPTTVEESKRTPASLTDDSVSQTLEAEETTFTYVDRALSVPADQQNTSMGLCTELGKSAASVYFLVTSKGADYVSPYLNSPMSVGELHQTISSKVIKYCGQKSLGFLKAAIGESWSKVAKNLIEDNYHRRSPYDQAILQKRSMADTQDPYDENAPNNSPKTLNLCFELGVIMALHFNAIMFGDPELLIVLDGGNKQLTLSEFRHNFRYRRNGCENVLKKLPLP